MRPGFCRKKTSRLMTDWNWMAGGGGRGAFSASATMAAPVLRPMPCFSMFLKEGLTKMDEEVSTCRES